MQTFFILFLTEHDYLILLRVPSCLSVFSCPFLSTTNVCSQMSSAFFAISSSSAYLSLFSIGLSVLTNNLPSATL